LAFLEVAGAKGCVEAIAPGSSSDLPQVAQSDAAATTSLPHSAQKIAGKSEGGSGGVRLSITQQV
jgi:hypothetical protein